jgi:hypothetical protein
MDPHTQNLDRSLLLKDLVHQPVLNIDAPGEGAGEVSNECLEARWVRPWVNPEQFYEFPSPRRMG